MTRTINLSNTQFRYQLVFFVHIYGYIWLAEGYLWHLLSRQNLLSASFAQAKHAWWYVCMVCVFFPKNFFLMTNFFFLSFYQKKKFSLKKKNSQIFSQTKFCLGLHTVVVFHMQSFNFICHFGRHILKTVHFRFLSIDARIQLWIWPSN